MEVKNQHMNTWKIELNDISFGNDTNMEEVLGKPKFQSHVTNGPINIFTSENVDVDGYSFNIKIFFVNKRIDKMQLIPVNLGMKDPGYPDKEYQEEKKKVSDSFLRKHFGEPLKENEAVLYYEFDWGSASSVAFLSGRNEYAGGFIEIVYKKTGE